MTDMVLTPNNELEHHLYAANDGNMDEDTFMRHLWDAKVFMPVNESMAAAGPDDPDGATPLIMQAEDGTNVVVLFSSAERAKPVLADMPGVDAGFEAPFSWVVQKMAKGTKDGKYGVILNPGWDLCLDIYADTLGEKVEAEGGEDPTIN